jgi:hypothetical protein
MAREVWFMVAWIVERHGAEAPKVAEEMVERLRREQAKCPGTVEQRDIAAWLAIRDAAVEWLRHTQDAAGVVH